MLILFVKQTRRLAPDYPCIGLLVTPASHVFWSLPSMVSTADIERPFIGALLYESTNRDFRWIHSLLHLALPSFLLIRCLRALDPWH
ncbi:hypothetical protein EJB05_53480 [Eragrostis curvula]|uniref:Uncharacterized protein n=1 Tax=Eragrostis curvula TaxID=38414 RepID=A0A5J9SQ70_9POAL|nr:hypothetical protein EJB05_53480 [Eragrostis curvula]